MRAPRQAGERITALRHIRVTVRSKQGKDVVVDCELSLFLALEEGGRFVFRAIFDEDCVLVRLLRKLGGQRQAQFHTGHVMLPGEVAFMVCKLEDDGKSIFVETLENTLSKTHSASVKLNSQVQSKVRFIARDIMCAALEHLQRVYDFPDNTIIRLQPNTPQLLSSYWGPLFGFVEDEEDSLFAVAELSKVTKHCKAQKDSTAQEKRPKMSVDRCISCGETRAVMIREILRPQTMIFCDKTCQRLHYAEQVK